MRPVAHTHGHRSMQHQVLTSMLACTDIRSRWSRFCIRPGRPDTRCDMRCDNSSDNSSVGSPSPIFRAAILKWYLNQCNRSAWSGPTSQPWAVRTRNPQPADCSGAYTPPLLTARHGTFLPQIAADITSQIPACPVLLHTPSTCTVSAWSTGPMATASSVRFQYLRRGLDLPMHQDHLWQAQAAPPMPRACLLQGAARR